MSKDDAISLINNSNLIDKMRYLQYFFLLFMKNEEHNLLSKKQRRDTK